VARSNERANERLARHIVSTVLGVPVDRFEDGMANRQVDALIHYPDRLAALEIVADHDAAFNAQWDALNRLGHKLQVPGLRQAFVETYPPPQAPSPRAGRRRHRARDR
jgi:hypothetical protein